MQILKLEDVYIPFIFALYSLRGSFIKLLFFIWGKTKQKSAKRVRKEKVELFQSWFHTHFWEPSLLFLPNLAKRFFGGRGGRERSSSEGTSMCFTPVRPVRWPRSTQIAHRHVPPACDARSDASFLACLIQDARRGCCCCCSTPEQTLQMFPDVIQLLELLRARRSVKGRRLGFHFYFTHTWI